MTEDWAAVSRAITGRMVELAMTQGQLIERSHVAEAIVDEIQHDTVRRLRDGRTLSALSDALDWHPEHLDAILKGNPPPPSVDLTGRLARIEDAMREVKERVALTKGQSDDFATAVAAGIRKIEDTLAYIKS